MKMRLPWRVRFLALVLASCSPDNSPAQEADLPHYLSDRGTGIPTSMFGSYVRDGDFLVYPFFEYYVDNNLEYKPSELDTVLMWITGGSITHQKG